MVHCALHCEWIFHMCGFETCIHFLENSDSVSYVTVPITDIIPLYTIFLNHIFSTTIKDIQKILTIRKAC